MSAQQYESIDDAAARLGVNPKTSREIREQIAREVENWWSFDPGTPNGSKARWLRATLRVIREGNDKPAYRGGAK